MDALTVAWLSSPAGSQALALAADLPAGSALSRNAALRKAAPELSVDQVAAVLSTLELREKAEEKFGEDAAVMFFERAALEQATRSALARHRAHRISLTGLPSVIDLGCGLGGDLIALSRAGVTAVGIDHDPLRVALAQANLAALGLPGAVGQQRAEDIDLSPFGVAFCDPARRSGRGRTFRPEEWSPDWEFVLGLLQGCAVVKLAPGLAHELVPGGAEAEWVSDAGDLKEAVVWSPALATVARRATVLGHGGLATLTEEDDPWTNDPHRPVRPLGEFVYEPDDAVIRAGLVTAVAAGVEGGLLDPKIAYVTSDRSFRTPFARGFRVVEQLPFREKLLKAALRERNIGVLTIKKRGVEVTPEALRQRLQLRGSESATVILTRAEGETLALLVAPF